ncbi:uncharacterized protein si:dkey-195m11.11 isoform X2 [Neoarius graeffei]|uniref:uncharacterized protein si:dkey-195m11.11 isoform X2 n=1 Tax=Neoarius graeffei TaxID=443677 RepID=UPI00298C9447|nr:uncharacterized protein si:dkey-195m11.11 isoform X2 [Neoarius graeffei]
MTLHQFTVRCSVLCLVVFAVRLAESQELLPAPSLSFDKVNQSAIKLYSRINMVCTVPYSARKPVEVLLSQADATNNSLPLLSYKLQTSLPVIFTVSVQPEFETAFVCWYRNMWTKAQSEFSKPINLVISALFDPILILFPPVFPVGAKYIMQCETPQTGYINTTLNVYDRLLPISPGKESFRYVGSRDLAPGEWGASITRKNAGETYEFICEMEVFFNGRTLRSRSKLITAMPEELPVRLVPPNFRSGTCYGNAVVKVRDDWRPFCFMSKISKTPADIICRELGCGRAISHNRLTDKSPDAIGTPNCTGNEKKIAECPFSSAGLCDQGTLSIICSEAFPPPKLSLSERNTASHVYIKTEESVTLECAFESSAINSAYITFTHNGNDLYTTRTQPGYKVERRLYNPVTEGQYACYVHTLSSSEVRTENSNVIGIYINKTLSLDHK